MKTITKVLLITALCLLLVGAALFVGVMAKNNWNVAALSADDFETNTYPVAEAFHSIDIRSDTEAITFLPSGDGTCRVEITEKKDQPHSVAVKDGTLRIEEPEKEKWSFSIGAFTEPKIAVYLPETEYKTLFIDESTGAVTVPADFKFESIDIIASTGAVDCRASASGTIRIETSTGSIQVQDLSADALKLTVSTGRVRVQSVSCGGALEVEVTTGRTELTDVTCGSLVSEGSTGALTMQNVVAAGSISIERSTGDVRFEACDAAELEISTDTGDVKGSLLTEKVFIARSDTGRIKVPETTTGGKCKITTDTGDIEIEIKR